MLDFGCGAGDFLLEMRAKGWECAGVEINDAARRVAREHDLDVRSTLSGPNGFPNEHFDYVRANHSLEHVLNPVQVVEQLQRVLKPGGTLFIGIPTTSSANAHVFGSNWWYLTPPLHTFVPSTQALKALVERFGFRVTRLATNSDYASTAGSLQIAMNGDSGRPSYRGILFAFKPLLLLGHWIARLQDVMGVGDKLELVAIKNP